jgi:hypothetical protein
MNEQMDMETPPPVFECVLLHNGNRFVVGFIRDNGRYFNEQDGHEFFPIAWWKLPASPQ